MANDIKISVFHKIFKHLDSNGENKVNGEEIDLNLIPEKLRKIFEPLVHELREKKETLSLNEFLLACDHVYNVFIVL